MLQIVEGEIRKDEAAAGARQNPEGRVAAGRVRTIGFPQHVPLQVSRGVTVGSGLRSQRQPNHEVRCSKERWRAQQTLV